MSKSRREKIEYFILFPVYFALALSFYGYLSRATSIGMNVVFFLCYFLINIMISVIFKMINNEKWDIAVSFAASLILSLIFRDRVLIANIVVAFIVTFFIYGLRSERLKRYGWVTLTAVILILWFTSGIEMPKYVAISLVTLTIYSLTTAINRDIRYFVAIPYMIAVITIFTPAKEEPMQWLFVRNTVGKVKATVDRAIDNIVYRIEGLGFETANSYTGYSGNGKISPGVGEYDAEELSFVNSTSPRKTIIYLRGRSLSDMAKDGFSNNESDEALNAWFVPYINALYHADIDEDEAAYFSKIMTGFFKYEYLRTEDTIVPLTPLYVYDENGMDERTNRKEQGYVYKVRYVQIDYGSPYYIEIVNSVDPNEKYEPYEVISKYTKEIYNIELSKVMSEEEYLEAAGEKDMSRYLDTSMATDRIRELAEEVTEGASSDYEKAYKIEEFLRQYEYDRSVDLTDSENYVDDFLFTEQKGYCVHYASAMVLMLRSVGIPARYAVGYRHNEEKNSNVMSNEAHSWPEAYIEGFGWVPFEPTGAMYRAVEYSWGLGENYEESSYVNQDDPWVEEWLQLMQDAQSQEEDLSEADFTVEDNLEDVAAGAEEMINPADIADQQMEASQSGWPGKSVLLRFAGYVGMMVGAVLLILAVIWLIRFTRYSLMKPEEKLRENVKMIMEILDKKAGDDRRDSRFMEEYSSIVEDEEKAKELAALFKAYSRIRFRGDDVEEKTVKESKAMYRYIKKCYN